MTQDPRTGKTGLMTRRDLLRATTLATGGTLLAGLFPPAAARLLAQQAAAADPVAAMRNQMAMAPIESVKLADNLTVLMGPGGNVAVITAPDGKVVVDSFVQPVFAKLKETIDAMGPGPIRTLIDTHWHFDHTDNNANFRQAGATIVAHDKTKSRMQQPHDLLGMRFSPSPAQALPTQTFSSSYKVQAGPETLDLSYVPPAHTDSDIAVHFTRANVLHLGDVFFNGFYPFIDAGTGGSINGMIRGASMAIGRADNQTKIIPGHGPVGDKAALTKYRDVLVTVRDRIQTQKKEGKKLEEVIASKPTAEFDDPWGKGFMMPNDFIGLVYNTL